MDRLFHTGGQGKLIVHGFARTHTGAINTPTTSLGHSAFSASINLGAKVGAEESFHLDSVHCIGQIEILKHNVVADVAANTPVGNSSDGLECKLEVKVLVGDGTHDHSVSAASVPLPDKATVHGDIVPGIAVVGGVITRCHIGADRLGVVHQ